MTPLSTVALAVALPAALLSQTLPVVSDPQSDSALIKKAVESTVPLQVALGAWRASQSADPQRGEWLRGALFRSSSLQPPAEGMRAQGIILDALIRSATHVPLSDLLGFFRQFPAAVIGIAARGRSSEKEDMLPLLLEAERAQNAPLWYAAASLLERRQLVHYLVDQVHFDYAITVTDQDFLPVRVFLPGLSGGVATPFGPQPAWPPELAYHVEMSGDPQEKLTCCVGGATYLKTWPGNQPANSQFADSLAWQDRNHEIVRVLLSLGTCPLCQFGGADFPDIRGSKATIVWRSADQTRSLLYQAIEQYAKECASLITALGETYSEYDARAKVRVWLRDWRQDQTIPIPSVGMGVELNRCAFIQSASLNATCTD